jgi:ABC-type sugar transport system, permease component
MTARRPLRRRAARCLLYIALALTAALMLVPFYWTVSTSLKLEQNVFASPPQWWPTPATLEHYRDVFRIIPNFGRYFLNSVIVAGCITLGQIFFNTLAAYAFGKLRFPGRDAIFFALLMAMMVPAQVNLIPLYKLMGDFRWLDSYFALVVPSLVSVFGIFMMRQFMQAIPDELLDAARMDACGELRVFALVALPLSIPGVATLSIFTFMDAWNAFLWPRIVTSSEIMYTLPVGLAQLQGRNTSNWSLIMAGTVLAALPMIAVFLAMQRKFIEGLTAGAIK